MKIIVGIAFALGLLVGLSLFLFVPHGTPQVVYAGGTPSGNGDVNASGGIDIADAIYLLTYLFAKGPVPEPIESPACDSCCPPCPPFSLPATGQTACYDGNGRVIDCASVGCAGQDGFYGKGCPTAERYVDNQDGTVTDTCTGLMWQKATAGRCPWQNALQYCEDLTLGGHSDWRLPNMRELQSIVDYGRHSCIDPIFAVGFPVFWSSTTCVYATSAAWHLTFENGYVGVIGKTNTSLDVRAVRDYAPSSPCPTLKLPGNVPLEMVSCPAGTFMMGRYAGEWDSDDREDFQHQVTLTQGFCLGKYEVTKRQWQAVMGTTPWIAMGGVIDDPESPAVYVSWEDTQSFIAAVNVLGQGTFSLPTEAQWEYACRAGTTTRFYWGDDSDYTQTGMYAWNYFNAWDVGEQYEHEVGQKLPNAWGLYDMSGNVWEWCQDWYVLSYSSEAVTDPTGPPGGSNRVHRGGSWRHDPGLCRSACRSGREPLGRNDGLGFRLARTSP